MRYRFKQWRANRRYKAARRLEAALETDFMTRYTLERIEKQYGQSDYR